MNRLFVICGPTATGKTSLALHLAKKFNGDLISADSRQVYKGMDIGTGKDIPKGFKFKDGYYSNRDIRIYGYDLVEPTEEFSVSQFLEHARKAISNIYKRGKLPILVGGTGLYIKGVVDGIDTAGIPRNKKLRKKLEEKSVAELYELLTRVALVKAQSLNESDSKNARRLIRAIEIAKTNVKGERQEIKFNTLFIGLCAPKEIIDEKIENRVKKGIDQGFEKELINLNLPYGVQSMSSLGYKQFPDIDKWISAEKRYVKRQMVWFKRDKRINWFDSTMGKYRESVEKLVRIWFNTVDAKKN